MKLTPNLIVESIEACLPFWMERLGFEKTVEVAHEGKLGFVILQRQGAELMLQSAASLAADIPAFGAGPQRAVLYFTVEDLEPIRQALHGYPLAMPERTTPYGARELIVHDPAGNGVCFGAH
jgi:uncharacterized glyoxalase superfamily protein PhnB